MRRAGGSGELASEYRSLISKTTHGNKTTATDEALLVDIDRDILGARQERVAEYETQIRAEYSWVPAGIYQFERRRVLSRILSRDPIYRNEAMRLRFEDRARENLERALGNGVE